MESLIREWVGKTVSVTLKVGGIVGGTKVDGKLVNVADAGALLEMPKGRTFIPIASIFHISLLNTN